MFILILNRSIYEEYFKYINEANDYESLLASMHYVYAKVFLYSESD